MPKILRNIVVKELREIVRDPRLLIGMIVIPVLMLPMMGTLIRIGIEATQEELTRMEIGFFSLDSSNGEYRYSDMFYSTMVILNLTVRNSTAQDLDGSLAWAEDNSIDTLVVLPADFSEAILANQSEEVRVYQVLHNYGLNEAAATESVEVVVSVFNNIILQGKIGDGTLEPARLSTASVIKGQVQDIPPNNIINTIMTSSYMIPLAVALILILAAQLAATSVAMEKEQKTLEVLLTLPIKRTTVLLGKLSGVIVVAALGTIAMVAATTYYASSIQFGPVSTIDLSETGLAPDALGYALLGISLFLSILSALALAVLLAAYTKDVRSAQSLLGILFVPIFMPAFLLMFAPVELLPTGVQAVIYSIPFVYPSLAGKALYTKEYLVVALGIIYQIVFSIIVLFIAARFFASEKVMTAGLKLRRGKKRRDLNESEV